MWCLSTSKLLREANKCSSDQTVKGDCAMVVLTFSVSGRAAGRPEEFILSVWTDFSRPAGLY